MWYTLLFLAAAAAAAFQMRVPLDRLMARSPTRWVALNGTQELPFSACFGTDFSGNWTAIKPNAVELSLPCNASYGDSYVTSFAYAYSYFRYEDYIHPTILFPAPGLYQHSVDVKVPRAPLTGRDMICLEMDGPAHMSCDLSSMYLGIY